METAEQIRNSYLGQERSVNIQDSLRQQEEARNAGLEGIEIRRAAKNLGKDDFLKLLVTQLAHQDPTQPVQDQQFIAQMAQFSSLEQMHNISDGIGKMSDRQAMGLVGKFAVGPSSENGQTVSGIVQALFFDESGQAFAKIGSQAVSVKDVQLIGEPSFFRQEYGGLAPASPPGSQRSNSGAAGSPASGQQPSSQNVQNPAANPQAESGPVPSHPADATPASNGPAQAVPASTPPADAAVQPQSWNDIFKYIKKYNINMYITGNHEGSEFSA